MRHTSSNTSTHLGGINPQGNRGQSRAVRTNSPRDTRFAICLEAPNLAFTMSVYPFVKPLSLVVTHRERHRLHPSTVPIDDLPQRYSPYRAPLYPRSNAIRDVDTPYAVPQLVAISTALWALCGTGAFLPTHVAVSDKGTHTHTHTELVGAQRSQAHRSPRGLVDVSSQPEIARYNLQGESIYQL
jgi:hypothetical protein